MAIDALNSYRAAGGKKLVYIGSPGSSGDVNFHRELASMELEKKISLWSWPGMEEYLMIYKCLSW
jgi:hypothetical protein